MDEDEYLDRLISSTEYLLYQQLDESNGCDELSLSTTSSSESGESAPRVIGRKRKLPLKNSLLPTDVRATYARDFVGALNSADNSAFLQMLQKIAIPKVVLVYKQNNPSVDYVAPTDLEVVGIETIAKVTEQYFAAIPDWVCKIINEKCRFYENGESCIGCTFITSGSKIMDIEGLAEGSTQKIVLRTESTEVPDNSTAKNVQLFANIDNEKGKVEKVPVKLGETQNSREFKFHFTLTMHLNVNKKVFLIVLVTE